MSHLPQTPSVYREESSWPKLLWLTEPHILGWFHFFAWFLNASLNSILTSCINFWNIPGNLGRARLNRNSKIETASRITGSTETSVFTLGKYKWMDLMSLLEQEEGRLEGASLTPPPDWICPPAPPSCLVMGNSTTYWPIHLKAVKLRLQTLFPSWCFLSCPFHMVQWDPGGTAAVGLGTTINGWSLVHWSHV